MTTIIGIDPGRAGGLCVLGTGICELHKMPETVHDLVDVLRPHAIGAHDTLAIVEKVASSPQMGVRSVFTFGKGYGMLQGVLAALAIPYELVTPQTWMRGLNIRKRGRDETPSAWKNHLKAEAQRRAPNLDFTLATCDAFLIAKYGRQSCVA